MTIRVLVEVYLRIFFCSDWRVWRLRRVVSWLFSIICLICMCWAQVSRLSMWRPRYRTFFVNGTDRLLKVIKGQFIGLSVNVWWADFDSFILILQSLYQIWSKIKCNWMKFEPISYSKLSTRIALSTAKSPVIV